MTSDFRQIGLGVLLRLSKKIRVCSRNLHAGGDEFLKVFNIATVIIGIPPIGEIYRVPCIPITNTLYISTVMRMLSS